MRQKYMEVFRMQLFKSSWIKYSALIMMTVLLVLTSHGEVHASGNASLINGGFEYPGTSGGSWWMYYIPTMEESSTFGWKTTNVNNRFELGGWNISGWGIGFAPEGNRFIELNADLQAAVYQDLTTTPGTIIYWSLYQGGVWYSNSPNIDNTMAVRIGIPDDLDNTNMITSSTTSYDQERKKRTIFNDRM